MYIKFNSSSILLCSFAEKLMIPENSWNTLMPIIINQKSIKIVLFSETKVPLYIL